MQGARLVTVAVPDNDSCEGLIHYCAEKMCKGINVMVVDLDPRIRGDAAARLHDKFNEMVRDYAEAIRRRLEETMLVTSFTTKN